MCALPLGLRTMEVATSAVQELHVVAAHSLDSVGVTLHTVVLEPKLSFLGDA